MSCTQVGCLFSETVHVATSLCIVFDVDAQLPDVRTIFGAPSPTGALSDDALAPRTMYGDDSLLHDLAMVEKDEAPLLLLDLDVDDLMVAQPATAAPQTFEPPRAELLEDPVVQALAQDMLADMRQAQAQADRAVVPLPHHHPSSFVPSIARQCFNFHCLFVFRTFRHERLQHVHRGAAQAPRCASKVQPRLPAPARSCPCS